MEIWSLFKQVGFRPVYTRRADQGNSPKTPGLKDVFTRSLEKVCRNLVVMFASKKLNLLLE